MLKRFDLSPIWTGKNGFANLFCFCEDRLLQRLKIIFFLFTIFFLKRKCNEIFNTRPHMNMEKQFCEIFCVIIVNQYPDTVLAKLLIRWQRISVVNNLADTWLIILQYNFTIKVTKNLIWYFRKLSVHVLVDYVDTVLE